MSQPLQTQSDFIDIRMNNGRHLGVDTFKAILNGRFHGNMQLAFEQYLTDVKVYGLTYRTYRYAIINGNMLVLQGIFNPLTAGPVRAAPVTRTGPQYPNAQTQGSKYQTPYVSQPNQPVANFPGHVNPSTVQTMRYATAYAAQMSTSPPSQLNPHAPEFGSSSAVNVIGTSARSSVLPTANSVPAYPPGLSVTRRPQSAPADAHRGYLAPGYDMQLSRNYKEVVRAAVVPSISNKPYSSSIHLQSQSVSRQSQLAPARPPGLAPSYSKPSSEFRMTPVSPLDLGPPNSSITDNPHLPPRQGSRQASEHNSIYSSDCSSMGYRLQIDMASPGKIIKWVALSTTNGNIPTANDTYNTSHSPQNEEVDSGIGSSRPSPERRLKPGASMTASIEHLIQQGLQLRPATFDYTLPSDPLSTDWYKDLTKWFYTCHYNNWAKSAPAGSTILDYAKSYDAGIDANGNCDELGQQFGWIPDYLEHRAQMSREEFAQSELQQPDTTPSQAPQNTPSTTASHPAGPSMASNRTNTAHPVARSGAPAPQQSTWTARHITSNDRVTLLKPTAPQQLHRGEAIVESDYDAYRYPHPAVDLQLEAYFPTSSDPRTRQRLRQYKLDWDKAHEEILRLGENGRRSPTETPH